MDSYNGELCEERHERIDDLLARHEEKIDCLEKCTIKLTQMIEMHDLICTENKEKIEKINSRPIDWISKIVTLVLSAVCGAISAGLLERFNP